MLYTALQLFVEAVQHVRQTFRQYYCFSQFLASKPAFLNSVTAASVQLAHVTPSRCAGCLLCEPDAGSDLHMFALTHEQVIIYQRVIHPIPELNLTNH